MVVVRLQEFDFRAAAWISFFWAVRVVEVELSLVLLSSHRRENLGLFYRRSELSH